MGIWYPWVTKAKKFEISFSFFKDAFKIPWTTPGTSASNIYNTSSEETGVARGINCGKKRLFF